MSTEFTAVGRYYIVYVDGSEVSQHTTEREACQKCTEILDERPDADVRYRHEYEVVALRRSFGTGGSVIPIAPPSTNQFQLADWMPAKMAMQIVHPRPDAEMSAYARAARAPSGVYWSIPIAVQGGARPFKYEIVTGPSGATIGSFWPSSWLTDGLLGEYGVLSWANPTVGNHSFVIRVTDQDGNVVFPTWTLEVIDRDDTSYFIWVDQVNGNNANAGSYSAPFQNDAGWYGGAKADATHAGKQLHYRAGTYAITDAGVLGSSGTQYDFTLSKPVVLVGTYGEEIIFDLELTAFYDFESGADPFFGGIKLINCQSPEPSDPTNIQRRTFIRYSNAQSRQTVFRAHFDGGGDIESDDGTNSAAIFWSTNAVGNDNQYLVVSQCTFEDCDNQDLVLFYNGFDVVVEGNRVIGSYGGTYNPSWGIFPKGGFSDPSQNNFSVAWNWGNSASLARPLFFTSAFTPQYKQNIEICWNLYRATHTGAHTEQGAIPIGQGGSGSTASYYGSIWVYRNNWKSPYTTIVNFDNADGAIVYEENVIEHDGTDSGFGSGNSEGFDEFYGSQAATISNNVTGTSGILDDTSLLLEGATRSANLGTAGCEPLLE